METVIEMEQEDAVKAKLMPKIPLKRGEELDIERLSQAHPTVRVVLATTAGDTPWEMTQRHRVFRWWLDRETGFREGKGFGPQREDVTFDKKQHPLLVPDTFQKLATVEDLVLEEQKTKAEMVESIPQKRVIKTKALARLGNIIFLAGGMLLLGYLFTKK